MYIKYQWNIILRKKIRINPTIEKNKNWHKNKDNKNWPESLKPGKRILFRYWINKIRTESILCRDEKLASGPTQRQSGTLLALANSMYLWCTRCLPTFEFLPYTDLLGSGKIDYGCWILLINCEHFKFLLVVCWITFGTCSNFVRKFIIRFLNSI